MKLTIDYEPTPKGVARIRLINGRAITYYHWKTTEALEAIRLLLKSKNLKPYPAHIPLKLDITFYRTKPKWYRPKSEKLPCRKPDLDNFLKWCIDGLSGIAFPDDAQITQINAKKVWSPKKHGYVEVTLEEDIIA